MGKHVSLSSHGIIQVNNVLSVKKYLYKHNPCWKYCLVIERSDVTITLKYKDKQTLEEDYNIIERKLTQ